MPKINSHKYPATETEEFFNFIESKQNNKTNSIQTCEDVLKIRQRSQIKKEKKNPFKNNFIKQWMIYWANPHLKNLKLHFDQQKTAFKDDKIVKTNCSNIRCLSLKSSTK